MIFYRYQNTKTLEEHSFEYIDMNRLYDTAVDYIRYRHEGGEDNFNKLCIFDKHRLFNYLRGHCDELVYRQNLSRNEFNSILRKIMNIILKYYNKDLSYEEQCKNRSIAWNEITDFMKPYPMKGLFVIPEYNEELQIGTKFSIEELRSNIATGLSATSAKYLAIYEGDIICKEMYRGGTLIKPKKLLQVFDLYQETDEFIDTRYYKFYRDSFDKNEAIKEVKDEIKRESKYNMDDEGLDYIIKPHVRELIIREVLKYTNSNYKQLQYRYLDDTHYLFIFKDNKKFRFCIPEEKVTVQNVIQGDNVMHKMQLTVTCLKTDTVIDKKMYNLNLAV